MCSLLLVCHCIYALLANRARVYTYMSIFISLIKK